MVSFEGSEIYETFVGSINSSEAQDPCSINNYAITEWNGVGAYLEDIYGRGSYARTYFLP